LSLDGRGREVILFFERTRDGIGKAEILKGGQKVVLSITNGRRPAVIARSARGGVRDTRVFGASVLVS
jgi:hypothetical protein